VGGLAGVDVNATDRGKTVLVPGGAGYVGSVLVPRLLELSYRVRVLDLYIYGEHSLSAVRNSPRLEEIKGDVRDRELVRSAAAGCDAVIHLACVSNDPSVDLDPALSHSINFESFDPLVQICKSAGVRRFIFASSGSVYGISGAPQVTEDHPLVPVSLYNKYKAMCERVLLDRQSSDFVPVIVRPATICGYSPRQRLDLTVNILTAHAYHTGRITVFGGSQMRPNLHMRDMVDLYAMLLELPDERVAGETFNAGYQNYSVGETARIVQEVMRREAPERGEVDVVTEPSDDPRSYRISSEKIERKLGFVPRYMIEDGVRDLIEAFRAGKIPDAMTDARYRNVKMMKQIRLT
jgi:nucleoside-diphosphate-sugar epimerase